MLHDFRNLSTLKRWVGLCLAGLLCVAVSMPSASAARLRLKDISHIKGVRDNQLIGYGLVVGLAKTGDKAISTQISQFNMIQNMGGRLNTANDIRGNNAAAVMITATVPPFAKVGDKIDLMVSSMADAKSLEGGVLLSTQLVAPNGEVIAVAQGPVSVGGVDVESSGSSKRTAITTSGRVPGGAIIERDMNTEIGDESGLELVLDKTDYTLASRVAQTVTAKLAPSRAIDGTTVRVIFPDEFADRKVDFLARLENIEVDSVDEIAKVVVNERTGTIVIGNHVRLLPAAVAHGGITVSITTTNQISQPGALATNGQTVGVSNSQINVEEHSGALIQLKSSSTLTDLVAALNAIGAKPSDLISILQALKAAGSLEARLEII